MPLMPEVDYGARLFEIWTLDGRQIAAPYHMLHELVDEVGSPRMVLAQEADAWRERFAEARRRREFPPPPQRQVAPPARPIAAERLAGLRTARDKVVSLEMRITGMTLDIAAIDNEITELQRAHAGEQGRSLISKLLGMMTQPEQVRTLREARSKIETEKGEFENQLPAAKAALRRVEDQITAPIIKQLREYRDAMKRAIEESIARAGEYEELMIQALQESLPVRALPADIPEWLRREAMTDGKTYTVIGPCPAKVWLFQRKATYVDAA